MIETRSIEAIIVCIMFFVGSDGLVGMVILAKITISQIMMNNS